MQFGVVIIIIIINAAAAAAATTSFLMCYWKENGKLMVVSWVVSSFCYFKQSKHRNTFSE
jgi:hypothetical protein